MPTSLQRLDALLDPELRRQFEDIGRNIRDWNAGITKSFSKIAEGLQRIQQQFPEQILVLARNGWFISSWHTPLTGLNLVTELFSAGKVNQGHRIMCEHFLKLFEKLAAELARRHPERARILRKAFAAHERKDYELSVPVFLAQADGIAKEILGESVYTRDTKKRKKIEEAIARLNPKGLENPMLSLVASDLPLTVSTDSIDYTPQSFSRHAILHGIDLEYGTKLNSLRALSWLQYASHFKEVARWSELKTK